jgi:hypothetical protein
MVKMLWVVDKSTALESGSKAKKIEGTCAPIQTLNYDILATINGLTTMAPNLALSKHVLIQDMISSKL